MVELINDDVLKKTREIRGRYLDKGISVLGVMESGNDNDVDVFYQISDDFFTRYPGPEFLKLLRQFEKDLNRELGLKVDIVDTSSLGPIGMDGLLKKIHYVDTP